MPNIELNLEELFSRFSAVSLIGSPGYSYPTFIDPIWIEVDESGVETLKGKGVHIVGPHGSDNRILIDREIRGADVKINFNGKKQNSIVVGGPRQNLRGRIWIGGDGNLVVVSETGAKPLIASWEMHSRNSVICLGPGATAGGLSVYLEGDGDSLQIGDDCQFSWGVWLRTADSHAIFDLASGKVLNSPKAIVLGPHVWLGQEVLVMGGAAIGAGTIVGARAVVTRSLEAAAVAVGMPARVVRTGVTWSRSSRPTDEQIAELQNAGWTPKVQ